MDTQYSNITNELMTTANEAEGIAHCSSLCNKYLLTRYQDFNFDTILMIFYKIL